MRSSRGWIVLAGVSLTVAGCFGQPAVSPASLPDGTVSVPTYPKGATACPAAALVPSTLVGSADDPDHVWAIGVQLHNRIRLVWPTGFYARLQPEVEVIDYDGVVVARGGAAMSDVGGGSGGDDAFNVCEINGRIYLPR